MVFFELALLSVISIGSIYFFNIIGQVISFGLIRKTQNLFTDFFIETLLGIVLSITLFSILKAGFFTINLGFIFLFMAFLFFNRKSRYQTKFKIVFFNRRISLSIVITGFLAVFLTGLTKYKDFLNDDMIFYLRISEYLNIAGKENFFHYFNDLTDIFNGTSPYHYFEFWLGALFIKIFNGLYLNSILFKYLCYGTLRYLSILGLIAFIEQFKKITFLDVLAAVCLSLFNISFITEFGHNDYPIYHNMWVRPNFIIYYLFLLPFFIFLSRGNIVNAVIFLLFLPIASTVTAPAIYSALGIYLILQMVLDKENKSEYFKLLGFILFLALFIMLFYKVSGINNKLLLNENYKWDYVIHYTIGIWKSIIFYCVTLLFRSILILVIPMCLIFLFVKDAKRIIIEKKDFFIFSFLLSLSGIVIFQLLTFMDNTYQFPYVAYVASFLIFIYFLYFIINYGEKYRMLRIGVIIMIIFYSLHNLHERITLNLFKSDKLSHYNLGEKGFDHLYVSQIEDYFKKVESPKGGFIYAKKDLVKMYDGLRHTNTYQLGNYLVYLKSNLNLLCLTSPDTLYLGIKNPISYSKAKGFNDLLPFYKSYERGGDYVSYLNNYIKKSNIDFLILSRSSNRNMIDSSLVEKWFVDRNMGHQFLILKRKG